MQQLQLLGKGLLCKTGLSPGSGQPAQSGGRNALAGNPAVTLKGMSLWKGPGKAEACVLPEGLVLGRPQGPRAPWS